ncbi:hypothetical protein CBM2634_P190003 [Cupriavidus taiwanensis]|uniref:Uncharacterized protein n=1 Tax=Cupriavidus taiwanensis TaxID=164546 RepID=A0A375JAS7_9BURK|nr:hypothetical protein CBM2634_P190003 [Cupriavidus taiwanensis]
MSHGISSATRVKWEASKYAAGKPPNRDHSGWLEPPPNRRRRRVRCYVRCRLMPIAFAVSLLDDTLLSAERSQTSLWSPSWLLQDLEGGLVAVDDVGIKQRVAKQVDHRLHGLAHAHHAGGDGIGRDVSAEAAQQCGLAIQGHAELVLAGGNPGQRRLGEQATGDDTRQGRRDLDAQIAARAGTLDALVLDDTDLSGITSSCSLISTPISTSVVAIVGTEAFGLRQVVTHHFAWQLGTRGLRPRLLRV